MQVRQQQKFALVALSLQLTKLAVCLLLNQQLEADNKLQVELEAESQKTFEHFGAEVCTCVHCRRGCKVGMVPLTRRTCSDWVVESNSEGGHQHAARGPCEGTG